MGRLLVEVFTSGNYNSLGVLTNILAASYEQSISEVGNFEFQVSALESNIDLLIHGRDIAIWREGYEEPEFRGKIQVLEWSVTDDEPVLVVSGPSLAIELTFLNTLRAIVFRDVNILDVYERLLSGTSWTGVYAAVSGSLTKTVTRRMDNLTIWQALKDIADIHGAILRETLTPRILEVTGNYEPTGILLTNQESVGVPGQNVGIISAVRGVKQDSTNLYNRIYPFGKIDGHDYFDLRTATSVSPYVVQMLARGHPEITNDMSTDVFIADPALAEEVLQEHKLDLEVSGIDRAIISLFFVDGDQGSSAYYFPAIHIWNGVQVQDLNLALDIDSYRPIDELNIRYALWQYSLAGGNQLRWRFGSTGVSPVAAEFRVAAIGFQNIDRFDNPRTRVENTGNGTVASTDIATSETDLVIDFFMANPNFNITADASQEVLLDEDVTGGAPRVGVSIKRGDVSGTTTMSWTISSAADWAHYVISLKGAPNYYIEDEDSIAAYGLREKPLALGEYKLINLSQMPEAANSLYDKTVTYLQNHKDPTYFYDVEVEGMPDIPWLVGDSFAFQYNGVVEMESGATSFLNVDDPFIICVKRRASIGPNGDVSWSLTLSTKAILKQELDELLSQAFIRLDSIQGGQV